MTFWVIAAVLALMVGGLLLLALLRRRSVAASAPASDLQVYRDQLREVERDVARGTVAEAEATRIRVEVSRRILEADRAATAAAAPGTAPRGVTWAAAGLAGLLMVGGSLYAYDRLGAPGYPDLPIAARIAAADEARHARPAQAVAEAEIATRRPDPGPVDPRFAEIMDQLRTVVADRPDDLQGQTLLAQNEARIGNFAAAHRAQARVIALKGDDADATDYANLADLLILAANGYVSPEAEAALTEALRRDPQNGAARYYSGLMFAQSGRPDLAFQLWRPLLEQSRPDDPWVPPVRAQIEEIAMLAGVRYSLPAQAAPERGPTAGDMAAAADMTPEERQAMIEGMVAQLGERLAMEGGPPADWARLIGALGVLGRTERAAAIWDEAQTVFAGEPEALATIRAAATRAGVAE